MNTFVKTGLALSVVLACGFVALPRDTAAAFDSPLATVVSPLETPSGPKQRPTVVSPLETPSGPKQRDPGPAPVVCGPDLITDDGDACTG